MLVQYAVENFKSIKDEIIINFTAKEKQRDAGWVAREEGLPSLYKSIALIGPNASGKSNIIDSFLFALQFILGTVSRRESSAIRVQRFRFEEEYSEKPASFEFIFYKDKIKYVYGFSVNETEVLEEYLMGYFTSKPKTIFDRSEGQHYEFKGNDVVKQSEMAQKTNKNRLYMPVAAEWGYQPAKEVYDWFNFISRQYSDVNVQTMISQLVQNDERKNILLEELQNADFNITDIYVKNRKIDKKSHEFAVKILGELLGDMDGLDFPEERPVIRVVHENSSGHQFDLALDEDSAGTQEIVGNLAELLFLSYEGGLMLEDELGKAYHTRLTQHFLAMIKSAGINRGNAQLLFTSHDTKVLNLLNPDQVYLVDKDESGATFVRLLDDYEIRERDNIELGYLKGRYGSIPYMRG